MLQWGFEHDQRFFFCHGARTTIAMSGIILAVVCIGGFVLYAAIGTTIVRQRIRPHVAEGHNDVLVPLFLTAGVIYAVLLGFMVVGEWETYDAAHANTAEEAALLVPLYRQTTVMAADKGDEMRHVLREYAEDVVKGWEAFAAGSRNKQAGTDVNEIFRVFSTLTPATKPREIIAAQFLQTFSQVILDRNKRYAQAAESLSWIMWFAAISGAVVTVGMSFILFMDRYWPHVLGVSIMAALIGALLFTLALLSRPFIGPLAIEQAPFEQALSVFDDVDRGN
jgi:hypothetical protein